MPHLVQAHSYKSWRIKDEHNKMGGVRRIARTEEEKAVHTKKSCHSLHRQEDRAIAFSQKENVPSISKYVSGVANSGWRFYDAARVGGNNG
jgi:hypothetical protein